MSPCLSGHKLRRSAVYDLVCYIPSNLILTSKKQDESIESGECEVRFRVDAVIQVIYKVGGVYE